MCKSTVVAKYPKAFAYRWADCWTIYLPYGQDLGGNHTLGSGRTAAQAWQAAAQSSWCSASRPVQKRSGVSELRASF